MVTGLEEVDLVATYEVDNSVLLGKPARPRAGWEELERFRLADAGERIAEHGFHDGENSEGDLSVVLDPKPEVLPELELEDRDPFGTAAGSCGTATCLQGQGSCGALRPRKALFCAPRRAGVR